MQQQPRLLARNSLFITLGYNFYETIVFIRRMYTCSRAGVVNHLLLWPTWGTADKTMAHYISMTITFTNDFTTNYQESVRIIKGNIDYLVIN